ncbi:hypothetical protein MLD38_016369 [Melastoma candidum]|uniref:Uncharacterized protein n=1 Tax=Melastoma candidum TaxID=119954 RepID=A0ACB9RJC1_9MYRT|nr:hypothetical protein MLD38_016369 [Melastoma candidum]
MDDEKRKGFASFLKEVPPVDFCCVYGSTLHPNNQDEGSMVDYILGVSDPLKWHSENFKLNGDHYSMWIRYLGGAKMLTEIADEIGVGVHFNPFVSWNGKMIKYGVIRMNDLINDVLNWERLYLSGRLQKPVNVLLDNLDIENVNSANLRAAVSAALLLLPDCFSEEELYGKICQLSYTGDIRMLFAEDVNKVKKIVQGQFSLFRSMYMPFLEEYETKNILRCSSCGGHQGHLSQDLDLSKTGVLVSSLPPGVRDQLGLKFGAKKRTVKIGQSFPNHTVGSREAVAKCMQSVLRRKVMVSSTRQAVSGFLVTGGLNAARYVATKMSKAWISRT